MRNTSKTSQTKNSPTKNRSISKRVKICPLPNNKRNANKKTTGLGYIFHGQDKEPHPFHVKSTWKPPVQPSVALESYLEEGRTQLAEVKLTKPNNNLPPEEREALKALKTNNEINLKKRTKAQRLWF